MSENTALTPDVARGLPLHRVPSVKALLFNDEARQQLATVAARHLQPDRLMRVVANAIRTTPKLQQADPLSFLGALMQAAALGLEPNTILGHAYLIPFDNKRKIRLPNGKWEDRKVTEVQLVVGYKGLIDLARRSGHITSISAGIHYSDDELWDHEEGTEARLRHKPGPQNGKKLHAYAIAHFREGGHAYVVLPWSHVLRIRDGSQGYKAAIKYGKTDNPWMTHEDAMAKKTAIRALSKYLPLSVEFSDALTLDGSKADYRGFAMDPSQGMALPMDEEGGYIEADAEAAPDPVKEEAEQTESAKPKEEAKPKPAPKEEPKASPKQEPEQELVREPTKEPEPEPERDLFGGAADPEPAATEQADSPAQDEPERDLSQNSKLRQFVADVIELKSFDKTADMWGTDFSDLKDTDPDLYAAIVEAGSKAEAEANA